MARRRNKGEEKRIARGRVRILLERSRDEALGADHALADRYAQLARRIAARYQVTLTGEQKLHVCKGCGTYRVPGRNSRTRTRNGRIAITCLPCGRIDRRPLQTPES